MAAAEPVPLGNTNGDETFAIRQESMDVLDERHHQILSRAINRILYTDEAELTYAQIVDGLPLYDVACDRNPDIPRAGHPLEKHTQLCPGVLDKTKSFRDSFDPNILTFDSRLLFAFQAASPGSRAFDAIIIELVAISIHQIAVILFSLDTRGHRDDGISTWAPPKTDDGFWLFYPDGPYPTLFSHSWYEGHERYPNGLADAVGYWAESCIFGGVVQFDRRAREVAPDADPDTLYLHPDRRKGTYRIFKVLPEQRKDLLRFLTSDVEPPPPNILPILATDQHAQRIDPEESSATTGIFRDIWERTEIPGDKGDARLRTMWDTVDYVTLDDKTAATRRAKARRWRHDYPDDPDGYWRNFLE